MIPTVPLVGAFGVSGMVASLIVIFCSVVPTEFLALHLNVFGSSSSV